jgi:hypothetical protein
MSLWVDSLTVAGLTCLTTGTAAQAWAFRTEFSILREALDKARKAEAQESLGPTLLMIGIVWVAAQATASRPASAFHKVKWGIIAALYQARSMLWSVLRWRWYALRISAAGGQEAVELGRLLRQASVWLILTVGSALVWLGAVIALVLEATQTVGHGR